MKRNPIKTLRNKADKKCSKCEVIGVYKNGRCHECFKKYFNEYRRKNLEKFRGYDRKRYSKSEVRKCKLCGKEFKRNKRYLGEGFCSRACAYENWKLDKRRKGKNNPGYRNGLYTKEAKKKTKKTTGKHLGACRKYRTAFHKKNDYAFCERCNTSNSLRFEVHHIVFASEAPKHKELHNSKNLIHLCISCHNELHKDKKLRNDIVEERQLSKLFGFNLHIYDNS